MHFGSAGQTSSDPPTGRILYPERGTLNYRPPVCKHSTFTNSNESGRPNNRHPVLLLRLDEQHPITRSLLVALGRRGRCTLRHGRRVRMRVDARTGQFGTSVDVRSPELRTEEHGAVQARLVRNRNSRRRSCSGVTDAGPAPTQHVGQAAAEPDRSA